MKQYLDLVKLVLDTGEPRRNRTGIDTLSIFGAQVRYDLRQGFPLLTTKRVPFSSVVRELLWFLSGSTNINDNLTQHTKIWDAWADENGDLGPVYGHQWRNWGGHGVYEGIDQIRAAIGTLKKDPDSRRNIVSAWNVADLANMRLPPCHALFQFNVSRGTHLDCQLYQRSADIALGVPFNVASYALLTSMIAQEVGLLPGTFVHALGDAHIYVNHIDGLKEQLTREPLPLPKLVLEKKSFDEMKFEDISLVEYQSHPAIKFDVAV